jgi:hypothetical protein
LLWILSNFSSIAFKFSTDGLFSSKANFASSHSLIAFLKDYVVIVGLIVGGAASQLWIWGFDKLKKRQEKKKG